MQGRPTTWLSVGQTIVTPTAARSAILFGLLIAPLTADAEPTGKVHRIGMLETRSTALNAANVDAFRGGLQELGYKEGQNIEIVYRSSDGRDERFPHLASALVRLKVDLIRTRGTPAALAAKNEWL